LGFAIGEQNGSLLEAINRQMVRRGKTNRFGTLTIERYQLWMLLRSKEKQNVLNSPDVS
jgi:hypothetical protein